MADCSTWWNTIVQAQYFRHVARNNNDGQATDGRKRTKLLYDVTENRNYVQLKDLASHVKQKGRNQESRESLS